MADVVLTAGPDGTRLMRRMTADYKAGRLTNHPQKPEPTLPASRIRLAKVVVAEISAESDGEAQLQEEDWTDSVEAVITVRNDSGIPIPVGSKMYVEVIQNKWRVTQAFIDCPE